jgi:hypothetical protein
MFLFVSGKYPCEESQCEGALLYIFLSATVATEMVSFRDILNLSVQSSQLLMLLVIWG